MTAKGVFLYAALLRSHIKHNIKVKGISNRALREGKVGQWGVTLYGSYSPFCEVISLKIGPAVLCGSSYRGRPDELCYLAFIGNCLTLGYFRSAAYSRGRDCDGSDFGILLYLFRS